MAKIRTPEMEMLERDMAKYVTHYRPKLDIYRFAWEGDANREYRYARNTSASYNNASFTELENVEARIRCAAITERIRYRAPYT